MSFDPDGWTLPANIGVFLIAALAIGTLGVRLVRIADILAGRTGLGGAIFGAIFVGATTSASGLVMSLTAAAGGSSDLAISNAVGGIAGQTAMLGIADIAYRKANLEHASASVPNLLQAQLLLALLAMPVVAMAGPKGLGLGCTPDLPRIHHLLYWWCLPGLTEPGAPDVETAPDR